MLLSTFIVLLVAFLSLGIGIAVGHMKSYKKIDITLNLVNFEEMEPPEDDGDGESLPANVTPIKCKDA